jgi:hypothetical protein
MLNKILTKIIETAYAQNLISCPDGTMADPSIGCVKTPSSLIGAETNLAEIILKFANSLMAFVAGVAIITLIYGGIRYAIAAGNENQIKIAKKVMFWGVFGLVVGLLAVFVTNFILDIVTY